MRDYPVNSPQAAARIVLLALVADGHLSHTDMDAVHRLHIAEQLGMDGPDWHEVLTSFCQDLLLSSRTSWMDVSRLDIDVLEHMMSEIVDTRLQRKVLRLCRSLAEFDGPVSQSESMMLDTAVGQWGLRDEMAGLAHA